MREIPARRNRKAPSTERVSALTDSIKAVSDRYEKAKKDFEHAEQEYAETLLAAYREGLSWAAVASAAGLESGDHARVRAERAMTDEEISPSRRRRASDHRPSAPGVSVTEAAKQLGCARSTIYDRIDRGELISTVDQLGRTRVLLD